MDNPVVELARDPQSTAERLAQLPMVVGVQVAGIVGGVARSGAAGVLDAGGERPVTATSHFRPGSITKLLTATLVMRAVDDGLLALDDPLAEWVPELASVGASSAEPVRVRHLISHSSGIDAGDLFVDTGNDDGCLERYAALLADAPLLFAPGTTFSYNNAGFVLAGLITARVRGTSWEDEALRAVIEPLGMAETSFVDGGSADAANDPSDAQGHLIGLGSTMAVPPGTLAADPMCTRGLAPAGGTLRSTATDLARFGAALLHDGGLVRPESALAMRSLQTRAPGGVTKMAGVGFGWQVWRHGERIVPRIGGANPGQSGMVAVDPDAGAALAVLTNSDQGVNAVNMLIDGMGPQSVADDEPAPTDLTPYTGTYRCHLIDVEVTLRDGALAMQFTRVDDPRWGAMRIGSGPASGDAVHALQPIDRTTFSSPVGPIAFLRDGHGAPTHLRARMRVFKRAA